MTERNDNELADFIRNTPTGAMETLATALSSRDQRKTRKPSRRSADAPTRREEP